MGFTVANETLFTKPNWRKFKDIPYNRQVAEVIKALGIGLDEIPAEGRPPKFREGPYSADLTDGVLTVSKPQTLQWDDSQQWDRSEQIGPQDGGGFQSVGDQAIKYFNHLSVNTSSGTALREWLQMWGWQPPARKITAMVT